MKAAVKGVLKIDGEKFEVWVPNPALPTRKAIKVFIENAEKHSKFKKEEEELVREIRAQLKRRH